MAYYDSVPLMPETSIGFLVRRVQQYQVAALDRVLAEEGLTLTQWSVMVTIHLQRATTCAELARDMAHDKGAMTRLIDQLEHRGLLLRERSDDDRRVVHLALSADGSALAMRCRERVADCWNRWLDGWRHEDVDTLIADLTRLATTLEESATA